MRSEDHLVRQGAPSALVAQSAYHTLKGFLGSPWAPSAGAWVAQSVRALDFGAGGPGFDSRPRRSRPLRLGCPVAETGYRLNP